jgi:hypothetical protein
MGTGVNKNRAASLSTSRLRTREAGYNRGLQLVANAENPTEGYSMPGRRFAPSIAVAALALGPALLRPPVPPSHWRSNTEAGSQGGIQQDTLSSAEMRARSQKLIANQHKDDAAIGQYERIERHLQRTGGPIERTIEDRTYRVVPTGSGTLKILLKDGGAATDPAEYRRQLQAWEDVLELMLKTDDSRATTAYEKYNKRNHDRAELVDAMAEAFLPRSEGQEMRNGRLCDVFQLDPDPSYHPHSILQDALTHVSAKLWVDHDSDQLVRGEAHIARDISFGGGILGKLYRGGVFSMEQAEVAPGIWLPTRLQYDFVGRKFLFAFAEHQVVETVHYRRVGLPQEALVLVKNELASGKLMQEDP